MEWQQVQKEGTQFTYEGYTFYDFGAGPRNRRAVVCGRGVLDRNYGFAWLYNPETSPKTKDNPLEPRETAAKILINQYRFSLIDHRSELLRLKKLSPKGEEIGYSAQNAPILMNRSNVSCNDREYAAVAA